MIKAPISLQDLRRRIYTKAKAEPSWRFWGLYVHLCKIETLHEAYRLAKANNGAPGVDGVTFEAIEASGVEAFLEQIQHELVTRTYQPIRYRAKAIPKSGGKGERILLIPMAHAYCISLLRRLGIALATPISTNSLGQFAQYSGPAVADQVNLYKTSSSMLE
jgi:hypothetical protein